ncbi:hypothetical protein [Aeromicrobium alkaliterrae]|uniref:Uncharacterized protein n=1 Tax=Aeromicrobium alkaliterrae TaxID=302168 RepID=A0ABN2K914_9ACTN
MKIRQAVVVALLTGTLVGCGGPSNMRDAPDLPDVELAYEHDVFAERSDTAYVEAESSDPDVVERYVAAAANEIAATQPEKLWYISVLCPSDDIESNVAGIGVAVFAHGDSDVLDAGDYDIPENLSSRDC